ncbi:unnamed protein product [Amoebophrya sp. A120]|nr:unnamed protein product [Amoebophrya sp. A120]|eukprot:GSA120T00003627001.1
MDLDDGRHDGGLSTPSLSPLSGTPGGAFGKSPGGRGGLLQKSGGGPGGFGGGGGSFGGAGGGGGKFVRGGMRLEDMMEEEEEEKKKSRNPFAMLAACCKRDGVSAQDKFLKQQRAYNWQQAEAEKTARRETDSKTFDFLKAKASDDDRVRFVLFVFFLLLAVGLCCSVMTLLFDAIEHWVEAFYRKWLPTTVDDAAGGLGKWYMCLHMIFGCAVSVAFTSYFVRNYIPECSGAGTDAARIAMAIGSPIALRIAFYRITVSSLYLGMGNPLGMEAPILHVCACVTSSVVGFAAVNFPKFATYEHLPTWVLVGIASGLSTAFDAPLAGITYAVEEVMALRKIELAVCLIGGAASVATYLNAEAKVGFFNKLMHIDPAHPYLLLPSSGGDGEEVHFGRMWFHSMLMGLLTGFAGEAFARILLTVRRRVRRQTLCSPPKFVVLLSVIIGILGSVCYVVLDDDSVWGPGRTAFQKMLLIPSTFEYDQNIRKDVTLPYDQNLKPLKDVESLGFHYYAGFFVLKLAAVILAASSGGPGGAFYPVLLLGGAFGGAVMCVLQAFDAPENAGLHRVVIYLAICGLFTSVFRVPLTGVFITYELTGLGKRGVVDHTLFPLMLTSLVSFLVSTRLEPCEMQERVELMDGLDVGKLFEHGLAGMVNKKMLKETQDQVRAAEEQSNSKHGEPVTSTTSKIAPMQPSSSQARKIFSSTSTRSTLSIESSMSNGTSGSNNSGTRNLDATVQMLFLGVEAQESSSASASPLAMLMSAVRAPFARNQADQAVSPAATTSKGGSPSASGTAIGGSSAEARMAAEQRRQFLKKFTPAQRILLRSSARARAFAHRQTGLKFYRLASAGDVRGVHQALLGGENTLDLPWIRDQCGESLLSLFMKKDLLNGCAMLLRHAGWDACVAVQSSIGENPLEESIQKDDIGYFLAFADPRQLSRNYLEKGYSATTTATELVSAPNNLFPPSEQAGADASPSAIIGGASPLSRGSLSTSKDSSVTSSKESVSSASAVAQVNLGIQPGDTLLHLVVRRRSPAAIERVLEAWRNAGSLQAAFTQIRNDHGTTVVQLVEEVFPVEGDRPLRLREALSQIQTVGTSTSNPVVDSRLPTRDENEPPPGTEA